MKDKKLDRNIDIFEERFPNVIMLGVVYATTDGYIYTLSSSAIDIETFQNILNAYVKSTKSENHIITPNDN